MKNIAIIGAGKMGKAIYKCLSKQGFNVLICDNNDEKLLPFNSGTKTKDANTAIEKSSAVIIAVKPQSFDGLCLSIKTAWKNKLAISIMAGINIRSIQNKLNAECVIRSMPNLGTAVEKGLTGWLASDEVTENQKDFAKKIFSSFGHEIELSKESMMGSITSLSGSGPAYFFYLCELMALKAEDMGFSKKNARAISEKTFIASAKILESSDKTANEWKEAVACKGGTTKAALKYLKEHGFEKIFFDAIESAKDRANELNK